MTRNPDRNIVLGVVLIFFVLPIAAFVAEHSFRREPTGDPAKTAEFIAKLDRAKECALAEINKKYDIPESDYRAWDEAILQSRHKIDDCYAEVIRDSAH